MKLKTWIEKFYYSYWNFKLCIIGPYFPLNSSPAPISSNSLPLKIMRPEEIIFHLFSQVLIGLSLYHSIILYASLSILLSISFSIPYVNVYETVQLKIYLNWRWSLKHGIYRIENNCERIIHFVSNWSIYHLLSKNHTFHLCNSRVSSWMGYICFNPWVNLIVTNKN